MILRPDSIRTHQDRWEAAQEGRAYWDREATIDLKYAAGKTWTTEQLEQFRALGQDPINYNLIHPMLNLVEGIEATTRADGRYLPKAPSDTEGSQAATALGLHVWKLNGAARKMSRAFSWTGKTGLGWMKMRPATDPRAERIGIEDVSPFDIWVDPCSRRPDLSDAADLFYAVWANPQYLANRFPEHRREILAAAGCADIRRDMSHSADYTNTHGDRPFVTQYQDLAWRYDGRDGVDYHGRLGYVDGMQLQPVERWYRQDQWARIVRLRNGRILEVKPENLRYLAELIVDGAALGVEDVWMPRIRQAVFIAGTDIQLKDSLSEHSHSRYPFVPLWAYEDENGRPMGLVRQARSPQKGFNSKIANLLDRMTSKQVHYESDAFEDVDEAARALADPNGMVAYRRGGLERVKFRNDLEASPVEGNMLQLDQKILQDMTGVTQELLGQETNAKSGRAIQQRQEQGQMALYTLLDNRNQAQELLWKMMLSDIQDNYTDEQVIRLRETVSGIEWLNLNQRRPDGTILNDITQAAFDTEVSRAPVSDTDVERQLQLLTDFAAPLPVPIKLALLEDVARLANLPNPEETVKKVTAIANALLVQMLGPALPGMAPQAPGLPPGAPPPVPPVQEGQVPA